jgi:hypothetical protein
VALVNFILKDRVTVGIFVRSLTANAGCDITKHNVMHKPLANHNYILCSHWLLESNCWTINILYFLRDCPTRFRFVFMVFNATFNKISVISWRSVLLEETGVPGENHRSVTIHWQNLSNNVVSSTPLHERAYNAQR